jgi:hypothetical protein
MPGLADAQCLMLDERLNPIHPEPKRVRQYRQVADKTFAKNKQPRKKRPRTGQIIK